MGTPKAPREGIENPTCRAGRGHRRLLATRGNSSNSAHPVVGPTFGGEQSRLHCRLARHVRDWASTRNDRPKCSG
jgi:hypothetical protein